MQTMGMKNLKSKKLYMQVYDELREYIFKHQLQPGDMLPTEMEMCSMLGVSRNVLREAIKVLEVTGMVTSRPGVGIIIQEFNPDFLFQTLFYNLTVDSESLLEQTKSVRLVLELGFMRQAFHAMTPDICQELRRLTQIMRSILREKQASLVSDTIHGQEFHNADASFHSTLFRNVDNRVFKSIIDAIWQCDRFHLFKVQTTFIENTVFKHEQIVSALEAHDYDKFREAMFYHFNFIETTDVYDVF